MFGSLDGEITARCVCDLDPRKSKHEHEEKFSLVLTA